MVHCPKCKRIVKIVDESGLGRGQRKGSCTGVEKLVCKHCGFTEAISTVGEQYLKKEVIKPEPMITPEDDLDLDEDEDEIDAEEDDEEYVSMEHALHVICNG